MSLRRLFPLFLLIILSFTLMTYQRHKGVISPLGFLTDPLNRANDAVHSFFSRVKAPFRKMALRDEENRGLREEMDRLILEQQRYRDLFFENRRLREILSLKEKERRFVAAARVTSKGWGRWADTVVIDKGRNDGIAKDMAVVTPSGLVGKVSFVTHRYAYVLLITDINFAASVKVQETRRETVLSGNGSGCVLKYFPHEEELKEGDVLVTSGFDELFPPELPVGFVSRVSKKGSGVFREVEVRPFQDLAKLDEVVVVRR